MYLYIHGFNSSSLSHKTQVLKHWLELQGRGSEWCCPDLPHRPFEAVELLSSLIESNIETRNESTNQKMSVKRLKLVGSSLGGFYANVLAAKYDLKAVVINPAIYPGELLKSELGMQTMWYSQDSYEFTQTHLNELNDLQIKTPRNPDNIFLMQERGDEVLDWKVAVEFYKDCHQLIFRGGDHGFTRFEDVLELIDRF